MTRSIDQRPDTDPPMPPLKWWQYPLLWIVGLLGLRR